MSGVLKAAALLLSTGLGGCGTVLNLGVPLPPCGRALPTRVYGGVEVWVATVRDFPGAALNPIVWADVVLSAAFDTLTLPYTLPASAAPQPDRTAYDPRARR